MAEHKTLKKTITAIMIVISIFLLSEGTAQPCRLYAVIADDILDGLLMQQLIYEPNSLKNLARKGNVDGWGIAWYPEYGAVAAIERGASRAYRDSAYDDVVTAMNASKPNVIVAHIRFCTSGCCAHGKEIIKDPHPFYRDINGKRWVFAHNGGVSVKRMKRLIGDAYLQANPPNGSGIDGCEDKVVDSEMYFLFLLKKIEEQGGDVSQGIISAVSRMVQDGERGGMNFILSDGHTLWIFRRGGLILRHKLYYFYDQTKGYSAVATQYPSDEQEGWIAMKNYELAVLKGHAPPFLINTKQQQ